MSEAVETHALYRFFDAGGDLLYIGITNDPGRRWGRHAIDKPWWHEVDRIEIDRYPDRASVLEAEQKAIKEECPKYNVMHMTRPVTVSETSPCAGTCPCGAPATVLYVLYRDIAEHREAVCEWKSKQRGLFAVDLLDVPKRIIWQAACDEHVVDSGGTYELPYPRSWQEWAARTAHLLEKAWFSETNWSQLLYAHGCSKVPTA